MNSKTFDLIVIGGGPAGISGANTSGVFGKRVALVEKEDDIGGAGINSGTLPSKTLRETALALSGFHSRQLFGVDLSLRREATIADFMRHTDQVSTAHRQLLESRMHHWNVERFCGSASFIDPHTIRIARRDGSEEHLIGDKILIATGSSPVRPPEFCFDGELVYDSDQLLHLKALPKRMVIIGAGVVGSEYACTFAAMGVEVHLVDGRDILLPFLDREVSLTLAETMKANGIQFHWNERATQCEVQHPGEVKITLASGATLTCDGLLVCAGRSSNTGNLNLAEAGITPGKRGLIPVGKYYGSEVPHIYAAGDVVGPPALAATGMEQARVAMCHAFEMTLKADMDPILPTGIYTIPEASMVGETEESLKAQKVEYVVGRARYQENARGRIVGDETGFLKLLFRRDDMRLLGAHVVGEQATEVIHIALITMATKGGADLFNRVCFNYPTLGDLYKSATYDAILRKGSFANAPILDKEGS